MCNRLHAVLLATATKQMLCGQCICVIGSPREGQERVLVDRYRACTSCTSRLVSLSPGEDRERNRYQLIAYKGLYQMSFRKLYI